MATTSQAHRNWWRCSTATASLLILTYVLPAHGYPRYYPLHRSCNADEPSSDLLASHRWLEQHEPEDNDLWNTSLVESRYADLPMHKRQTLAPLHTIDTYFHIVSTTAAAQPSHPSHVSQAMIDAQFAYLQDAYRNASLAYRLAGVTRTVSDPWASNADDRAMKTALRSGSYAALNIYFQTNLQTPIDSPAPGETLLGFCTLPAAGVGAATPRDRYALDGCNVLGGTMPGGGVAGYNLGGTAAHEVGHWNGLLHTFAGSSCDVDDWGDFVADTPQERTATDACPVAKDTCPTSGVPEGSYTGAEGQGTDNPYGPQGYSGPDPVHNIMDYSADACYQGFTPGQAARMLNIWAIYREGR